MKYLMLVLIVAMSVSATELKYWEGEYPWPDGSTSMWTGVKFEYSDFDPDYVGMEIQDLELGFRDVGAEPDSIPIFIFDGWELPDDCSIEEFGEQATREFKVLPNSGLHVYVLPEFVAMNDLDGFWVIVYTEDAHDGGTQLTRDPQEDPGHTYSRYDSGMGWWDYPLGQTNFEAHITVHGEMTMSLEPLTWGSLKSSF